MWDSDPDDRRDIGEHRSLPQHTRSSDINRPVRVTALGFPVQTSLTARLETDG